MTEDELRSFPHRFYAHWNSGDMESAYAMLDEHIVDHMAGEGESGLGGVRQALDTIRTAFPDHHYEVDDVIVDATRNRFAAVLTASGTHQGDLFGLPPTGRSGKWTEVRICTVRDGKAIDHRAVIDSLAMMTQLGHVPPPGGSAEARASW